MARDQVEKGDREMAMQIDEARDLLWSAAHHWHFQGATESNLSFICCSCECTGMVEAGEHGYLRYSLLRGSQLIGSGRGFMTGDSVMEYEFIDSLGSKAEGAIISNIQPEMAAVASEPWKNSYRALERRSPGMDSITGHAAAEVLLEGIKRANTARGSAVADALRKLELKTLIGDWSSDAKGDMRVRKIYLFQVRNGAFEQIGEER